ncbi:MAG: sulfatase [Rikenellaceae bacterium]
MNRSILLCGVGLLAVGCTAEKQQKPNIIFIMSDDHASQGIGIYGSRLAKFDPTPTIDRIGSEGIVFENCFCTNSISTPSRACITTGQYSQTNTVLTLNDSLPIEKQYLPQEMKKLGYQTAIVGKWHLHAQPEMYDYYNVFYGQGAYFDPILCEKGQSEMVKVGGRTLPGKKYIGHSSDIVMDITLDWLKNKRDKDKPFFLQHHFKAPHDNFEFNPRYADYLADEMIPEPASMYYNANNGSVATRGYNDSMLDSIGTSIGRRNIKNHMGNVMGIDPSLPDDEYKHQAYQEYIKRYLRCIKGVDDNVKRLFDYLEAEGLMDNTIIMYTGDQGFMLGEHDYIDKRWMYEESHRMPLLVRYPEKIKAGIRTDAMVNNVDFAPTIISLAGGDVPEYMQGESMKEILYNEGDEPEGWKQATYYRYWMHMIHHSNPGHFGIRTKDYKLIFFYGQPYKEWDGQKQFLYWNVITPPAWEFYDLRKDPEEMNNCYADPKYADVIADLKVQLKEMRHELNEEDGEKYPNIQAVIDANWDL